MAPESQAGFLIGYPNFDDDRIENYGRCRARIHSGYGEVRFIAI